MRLAQALEQVTRDVNAAFDADVADAITGDTDMFEAAVRAAGRNAANASELTDLIKGIAADVDDGLADWLTESAVSPAGWLFKQINER